MSQTAPISTSSCRRKTPRQRAAPASASDQADANSLGRPRRQRNAAARHQENSSLHADSLPASCPRYPSISSRPRRNVGPAFGYPASRLLMRAPLRPMALLVCLGTLSRPSRRSARSGTRNRAPARLRRRTARLASRMLGGRTCCARVSFATMSRPAPS